MRLLFARGVLGLSLAVLVLLLGLYLRLLAGPLSISAARPYIQDALEEALPGTQIRLKRLALVYEGDQVAFRAENVQLTDAAADLNLALRQLGVRLDLGRLVLGDVAVTQILFTGPRLTLDWSLDGGGPELSVAGGMSGGERIDAVLARAPLLKTISIRAGELQLRERASGQIWTLAQMDGDLRRGRRSLQIDLTGQLRSPGATAASPVSLQWRRDAADHGHRLVLALDDWRPAAYAPTGWTLADLDLPLSLDVRAELDPQFRPKAGRLELTAAAGRVNPVGLYAEAQPIQAVRLDAQLEHGALEIATAEVDLPSTHLSVSGRIADILTAPRPMLTVLFDRLSIADLVRYWPPEAAPGGRRWVAANIEAGFVRNGVARFPGSIDDFVLDFGFERLTTRYIEGMPPAWDLTGSGQLTAEALALAVQEGQVAGLRFTAATVDLDLAVDPQVAAIAISLTGSLRDTLSLADHPPLGFLSRYGLDPAASTGRAQTKVSLAFPLIQDLALDAVEVQVSGQVAQASLPVRPDIELTEADLSVTVTDEALDVAGTGTVAGLPTQLTWQERFADGAARYALAADVAVSDLTRFGIDMSDYAEGVAAVQLELLPAPDGRTWNVTAEADLTGAALTLDLLDWRKAAGTPARLSGEAQAGPNGTRIGPARLEAKDLLARAALALDAQGRLKELVLTEVSAPGQAFEGLVRVDRAGRIEALLEAEAINLGPLITQLTSQNDAPAPPPDQASETETAPPPLQVTVTADRAMLRNGVPVRWLYAAAERDSAGWRRAELDAEIGPDGRFQGRLVSGATGRRLELRTEDAGTVLRGLGVLANAMGGDLVAEADISGPDQPQLLGAGRIRAEDFVLVPSRTLDSVIEAGAAEGLDEVVDEDGLRVGILDLPFRLHDGLIDIEQARANGPRLGVTLEGQIAQDLSRINVNGIIVPVYRLNALINNIPIIGDILAGGRGEGLFALTYRIAGDLDDPAVEVNPLTALAPGIIRRLFENSKGTLADLDREAPAPVNQ
ncbi:MAG: AsmA-like C-terminal domain-containing protein [Rhodothalassiaceae bacterium]